MEASERAELLDNLAASRQRLMDNLQGLTGEQWEFRPSEGSWSIADCVEHVVLVESRVLKAIGRALERAPEPEKKAQAAETDRLLGGLAADRTQRLNAPEPVTPKRHWPDTSQLLGEFEKTRVRTVEFSSATDGDLRNHFFPHPIFGDLDCYQWLRLVPLHCDRHLAQIQEIKSNGGFPQPASVIPA